MFSLGMLDIYFFGLGACIGSFLNVCIIRMPKSLSVLLPPSHCVSCKIPLKWYDNIPLVSFLVLGGRCRVCQAKFSKRYFFVELLTGVIFLGFFKYYGLSPLLIPYLVMVSCFMVATFVDFEHRIIPDEISIGGMLIGLACSFVVPQLHGITPVPANFMPNVQALGWAVVGVLVGGGPVYLMGILGNLFIPRSLRKIQHVPKEEFIQVLEPLKPEIIEGLWSNLIKHGYMNDNGEVAESYWAIKKYDQLVFDEEFMPYRKKVFQTLILDTMGGGDVKLMGLIGAFMGWKLSLLTFFFFAPFFGAIYGIIEKIRTKDSAIPYGPFIVLGAVLSLFYGNQIITWALNGYVWQ